MSTTTMFPLKNIVTKFKHAVNVRGLFNQLLFSGCFLLLVWCIWSHSHPSASIVPKAFRKYLRFPEGYTITEKVLSETELRDLMLNIEKLNLNTEVFHWLKHGAVAEDTTILAVQVHKDAERLQHLIVSLAQAQFIQNALLIFSHSYYDDDINALVRNVDFCKYMQIFYPYSLQLHPDRFPGVDPDDCNATAAAAGDCFDRDARRTEHKQHWWWKAHFIFDGLDMPSHKRVVVFLEEDDYVLPDFLYMLRYARRTLAFFPTAEVIALGRPYAGGLDYDKLLVDAWTPLHDRGLAFNLSTWRRIKAKASLFCMYDDCSWSYSLVHLFGGFPGGPVDAVVCMAPRVLAMRSGVGAAGAAGARAVVRLAGALASRAHLFPGEVRAVLTVTAAGRARRDWRPPPHGNGGWSDLRDQVLCLDPVMTTTLDSTTNTFPAPYPAKNYSISK